ncbi:MAG: DegT/DnrJ/EryC1/StrS family aminotransferase [archaeon]|nr:DegT/DnrJ/EryC1/StrS family aminotransferase [archaeon]
MEKKSIPLFKIYWDEADVKSVESVIRRGTYWATGPEIAEFEKNIAKYIGRAYCVAFNSGTSALHCMLLAYNITSGEVIVPSFTFIATANSVVMAGAKPVFAEVEEETFGLDVKDVEKKINEKTKAIIIMHYGGMPCRDTLAIKKLAKEKNLFFFEDAAESCGAEINGKKVSSFGDAAILSFCQNKIITTGEGGAVLTDSEEIYEKLKLLRSHGRLDEGEDYFSSTKDMDYISLGYNFRMPAMCAALGNSQLVKIDKIIESRKKNAEIFNKALLEIDGVKIQSNPENFFSVYQMYTIKLENKSARDSLQEYLQKNNITSKIYFPPLHLKTFYKKMGFGKGNLPRTERLSEEVLTIPFYPSMTRDEILLICEKIAEWSELR